MLRVQSQRAAIRHSTAGRFGEPGWRRLLLAASSICIRTFRDSRRTRVKPRRHDKKEKPAALLRDGRWERRHPACITLVRKKNPPRSRRASLLVALLRYNRGDRA